MSSVKGAGSSGSSNSAAAAEAAAQQRAEEAARRAAEAAREAAEAARRAAEAAKQEAEAAKRAAEEAAKQAAQQAKQAAEEAQKAEAAAKKASDQRAKLEQNGDKLPPEEKKAATEQVDAADKEAASQSERAKSQQQAADKAKQDAIQAGEKALSAQKTANQKAKEAGASEPYKHVEENTFEEARPDAAAQRQKLLGGDVPPPTDVKSGQGGDEDKGGFFSRAAGALGDAVSKGTEVAKGVADKAGDVAEAVDDKGEEVAKAVADKAGDVAQDVADKAGDVAKGVADKAGDVAKAVDEKGEEVAKAVADKAKDVADKGKDVAKAVADKAGDVAKGVTNAAKGAASFAGNAARSAADVAKVAYEGQKLGERVLGNAVKLGGKALLEGGKNVAEQIAKDPVGSAKTALKMANELANAPRRLQQAIAKQALEVAKDPVGTAKGVVNAVRDTADALNVEKQIGKLGPNDSYKLAVGADGSVSGLGGEVKGNVTVSRGEDGKYTVAADGAVGAGALSELGAVGAADTKGKLMATQGAKVEFKFDNAEDAEKATRTLMGPTGAASALLSGDSPLPDPGLLAKNISAIELNAGASGELSASLGLNSGKSGPAAGLNGALTANANVAARIEFNDGKPDQLVLKQRLEVGANGSGGLSPMKDAEGRATFGPQANVNLGGKGSVEIEERFDIPGMGVEDLKDPAGAVEKLKDSAVHTGQITATLKGQLEGSASIGLGGPTGSTPDDKADGNLTLGKGALEAEMKLTGKVEDVLKSGGLDAAMKGDFSEAMRRMSPVVKASGSVTPVVTSGPDIKLGGGAAVGSLSVSASATTTDKRPKLLELEPTSVDQLNRDFQAYLDQQRLSSPLFAGT